MNKTIIPKLKNLNKPADHESGKQKLTRSQSVRVSLAVNEIQTIMHCIVQWNIFQFDFEAICKLRQSFISGGISFQYLDPEIK